MTRPVEQEPTVRASNAPEGHAAADETVYEHPAYALIGVNRVSGLTTLFDSDFEHQHYMTIRIARAELHRNLARDWHFGREQYIEVSLSESQWATFVSSPNIGQGTPCTLTYLGNKAIPSIPRREQMDTFTKEVQDKAQQAATLVNQTIAGIEAELGEGISGKKKAAIVARLVKLRMELGANLPFIVKSAEEHMENVVEAAKTEVNAYMNATVQRAGLAAIAAQQGMPLLLPASADDPEGQP